MNKHNLLTKPLIAATDSGGHEFPRTLPEVLAGLAAATLIGFPHLRPHQAHAWHAFLVQLAASALHRAGHECWPDTGAVDWATALRGLTPGHPGDEPWCLVVADWRQPALLQPPAPVGAEADYRGPIMTPDQIDLLVTAKNHDVKAARIGDAAPDHWLFALVALQTMEGFLGAGNYGVARMNGGFSSRPCLSLTPGSGPAAQFRRDVAVMLARRAQWLIDWPSFYRATGGMALLWLEPWDGVAQIGLESRVLDPWFVEICRRMRLVQDQGRIHALKAGSKAARLAVNTKGGNIGDPWTPVEKQEGKALSLTKDGFRYDRLKDLLFGNGWRPAPLQEFVPEIDDVQRLVVVARGLARGQGKTEGYHERILPIPRHVRHQARRPDERARLGTIATDHVEQAKSVIRAVLWPALMALHDDKAWVARWTGAFDTAVDARFFEFLWPEVDPDGRAEARRSWRLWLRGQAGQTFGQACRAVPRCAARDYKIVAHAEAVFFGCLGKMFADLRSPDQEPPAP